MSFYHAPVTKGLMIGTAATSIAASIFDVKHHCHLQLVPHISKHHQYWRLLVHHLAASSSGDLLLIELLLYNIAIPIERRFGSSKFASFAAISTVTSTLLEIAALLVLNRLGLNILPAGPIPLTFSIIFQFFSLVPSAYHFKVFGITVSNRIFTSIIALQLIISQPPGSVASSVIGLLAGRIYRSDVFSIKSHRLPQMIQRWSSRIFLPVLGATKPPRRSTRAFPDNASVITLSPRQESASTRPPPQANPPPEPPSTEAATSGQSTMRNWVNELTGGNDGVLHSLRVPSSDEITQLSSMFPDLRREDVVGALQRSPNIETAVDTLLSAQTS